jgi:hypothetical protein
MLVLGLCGAGPVWCWLVALACGIGVWHWRVALSAVLARYLYEELMFSVAGLVAEARIAKVCFFKNSCL